jgi:hypothetical protein
VVVLGLHGHADAAIIRGLARDHTLVLVDWLQGVLDGGRPGDAIYSSRSSKPIGQTWSRPIAVRPVSSPRG